MEVLDSLYHKMEKKGLGSIVAIVLITLLSVVGIAILFGAVFKTVGESTSNDASSCLGIDLKVSSCDIYNDTLIDQVNLLFALANPINGSAIVINLERLPGGGEIKDLRFQITDELGNSYIEEPVDATIGPFSVNTNYTEFVEYGVFVALARDIMYNASSVRVSAVVGSSETICAPTRPATNCGIFGVSP